MTYRGGISSTHGARLMALVGLKGTTSFALDPLSAHEMM